MTILNIRSMIKSIKVKLDRINRLYLNEKELNELEEELKWVGRKR